MVEILAPCGSPEVLNAALRAGCGAVYLGGKGFSARQNSQNFTDEEIEQAVYECHRRGVKLYRTINTVVFDDQLDDLLQAVRHSAKCGVDGLITQDLALVEIVKSCCPDLPIHASTQMTVHTAAGVEICKELGFSRVVTARELPIDIISELCKLGVEIEVFVHGALCMSVSGQCYMSAVVGSRSANRGLCAQACRLPCSAVKDPGAERYDLSLKDMSCLDSVGELVGAGVASLKIEGRMKRPEYVAASVDSLKKALAGEDYDRQLLADVFSRSGFTDGYLHRRLGREMFGQRRKEDVQAAAKALPAVHSIYRFEDKRDAVDFEVRITQGERVRLTAADSAGLRAEVVGDEPQRAKNRPTDLDTVIGQLGKLGDTIYTPGKVRGEIGEGLFVSPAAINELRRQVCAELDRLRAQKNTRHRGFDESALHMPVGRKRANKPLLYVTASSLKQLGGVDFGAVAIVGVPLTLYPKAAEIYGPQQLAVLMPRFTFDENAQTGLLERAAAAGAGDMFCTNPAHIALARRFGMRAHLSYGFNLTNSLALKQAQKLGAASCVASFELKAGQINRLKSEVPLGVYAYGRLPLMMTVNCPVSQAVGCKACTGRLSDRTGRQFRVKCSKAAGYVEILNSEVLYLADKLGDFAADHFLLEFFDESPDEVAEIIGQYSGERPPKKPAELTRGLYYRGVL